MQQHVCLGRPRESAVSIHTPCNRRRHLPSDEQHVAENVLFLFGRLRLCDLLNLVMCPSSCLTTATKLLPHMAMLLTVDITPPSSRQAMAQAYT